MTPGRRTILAGTVLAAVFPLRVAAAASKRIGILDSHPRGHEEGTAQSFVNEMAKHGYVEGKNVEYLHRHPDGDWSATRLEAIAMELVRARPDAILATGTALTRAIARATRTIPVVTN